MAKREDLRVIPPKNYLILIIIFLITFLLAYYVYSWYHVYQTYQNSIPVIRDTLPEVNEEEFTHYVEENPTAVLYICTAENFSCRSFEKKFKILVENKSLKEYITYVNLKEENKENFLNSFNNKYEYKKELENFPALVVFKDGKISDLIQYDGKEEIKIHDIENFLKENKIGVKYE